MVGTGLWEVWNNRERYRGGTPFLWVWDNSQGSVVGVGRFDGEGSRGKRSYSLNVPDAGMSLWGVPGGQSSLGMTSYLYIYVL